MKQDKERTQLKKQVSRESFLRVLPKEHRPDPENEKLFINVTRKNIKWHWYIVLENMEEPITKAALALQDKLMIGNSGIEDGDILNLDDIWGGGFGISKQHARLQPTTNNLFIMDLNSTNGTFVNGVKLFSSQVRSLEDGNLITLGRLHLRLRIVEKP